MNYYNEFDPKAAAWLKQLIQLNLIPQGDVDTRSITEVKPHELTGYTQCHFFAGIGGWSLALQLAGWPSDRPVFSGSCPCQPFSTAGKGLAQADERHLWPVFFNLIKECRPQYVFGEQVASSAVVGKRSEMDTLQQMRRKQAILRFLSGEKSQTQVILQGLQEQANQPQKERELFSGQDRQEGAHFGWRSEIQGQKNESSIRFGCGGDSFQNRDRSVRVDRNTIRSGDAESMEQPIIGSDKASSWIHQGQCESSSVFCKCDESQLGAEVYSGSCGCNTRTAQEEIERLIGEIGGESEEAPIVWVDGVQDDLEKIDYTFGSCVMAASSVGAPHIRQRLYWVAYDQCARLEGRGSAISDRIRAGGQTEPLLSSDRLAHTESIRSREGQQDTRGSVSGGDEEQGAISVCGSSAIRLGDTSSERHDRQHPLLRQEDGGRDTGNILQATGSCETGGLADARRSEAHVERVIRSSEQGGDGEDHWVPSGSGRGNDWLGNTAAASRWSDYQLIPCRDGKTRRIPTEPSFFPLAHGIPARVVRLRGYGNAIVPQAAAEFIQAFQETQAATA